MRRAGQAIAISRGFLASYVRKELACTLKDPAVAMNALGGYIAIPIVAVSLGMTKARTHGQADMLAQLSALMHMPGVADNMPYVVVGVALVASLLGSMTSLFSASYSKDGRRLWVEKSLPVRPL